MARRSRTLHRAVPVDRSEPVAPGFFSIAAWRPSRWAWSLIALAAAAFAVRIVYLVELRATPFWGVLVGDAKAYDAWAREIAAGNWLGSDVFYQSPLYPYLLGLIYKIAGAHAGLMRSAQAAMDAGSCVALAIAGRHFFSRRVGLAAGALLAIYPPAIFFDGLVQKPALDLLLVTSWLAVAGIALTQPRMRWFAASGVLLGLFMLNRENARVLYPVVLLWVVVGFRSVPVRRRIAWAGALTAAVCLILVPVGLRNRVVGGEFLVSTSQFGPNFYIGNHAGARGGYEPLVADHGSAAFERRDATELAERAMGRSITAGEVSDYWFRRAVDDIRRDPAGWARLIARKAALTLNAAEMTDTESLPEYREHSMVLQVTAWLNFGGILTLAGIGLWVTRDRWRQLSLLYAVAAAFIASVALFYVFGRYRFALVPVLLLFAAAALWTLPNLFRDWRRAMPAAAIAGALAVLTALPLVPISNDANFNVGTALLTSGRPTDAVPLLRRAVTLAADDAPARFNLGIALHKTGAVDDAITQWTEAIRIDPSHAQAREALGSALQKRGRAADIAHAIDQFATVVSMVPGDVIARNRLAGALQQAGRSREAVPQYAAALDLAPDNALSHSNLALALIDLGQTSDALAHLQAAVRLDSGNYGIRVNFADLLLQLGRTDHAIGEYEAAVRILPDDVPEALSVLTRLAHAYAQAGRQSDAHETIEHALTLARVAGLDDAVEQLMQLQQNIRTRHQ